MATVEADNTLCIRNLKNLLLHSRIPCPKEQVSKLIFSKDTTLLGVFRSNRSIEFLNVLSSNFVGQYSILEDESTVDLEQCISSNTGEYVLERFLGKAENL